MKRCQIDQNSQFLESIRMTALPSNRIRASKPSSFNGTTTRSLLYGQIEGISGVFWMLNGHFRGSFSAFFLHPESPAGEPCHALVFEL